MRGRMLTDMVAAADAYLAWWELAGVDCATGEEPVDWLRPVSTDRRPVPPLEPSAPMSVEKPATLHAFRAWLAEDGGQPERRWHGRPVLPQGRAGAELMIITDMPDPADMSAAYLIADRPGQLFDAMLGAMGLKRADIYLSSLFLTRPPGGMIEAADLVAAADRMRTHVSLAAPRRLLILGDRTVRAFVRDAEPRTVDNLLFFSHDGVRVPALATFHPRLLIGQPAAKAECWRTLQSLFEEQNQ